ncbi:MAG: S41 family peptidase [Phycisphaerae bacterium]|nr:S41 family peptidase [Phycisphaerae bacterium]
MSKNKCHKANTWLIRLAAAAMLLPVIGCKPDEGFNDYRPSRSTEGVGVPEQVGESTLTAVERILRGDFDGADVVLQADPEAVGAATVRQLLARYEQLEEHRRRERQAAYDEQIAELRRLEGEMAGQEPPDPNSINEAMVAVILAREYAADENKDELLSDSFVQRLIDTMLDRGMSYRQEGKWVDAYANCYYWMTRLFEDDPSFKEIAEQLTELASIEVSLKDSGCGENAAERHEGIRPDMLLRAVNALETNYVNGVAYRPMIEKAVLRCELLGEVLLKNPDELAWKAEPEAIHSWLAGVKGMDDRVKSEEIGDIGFEQFVRLFDEVLGLNAATLRLPQEVIIAHFSEAALSALDPYTTLIWPWSVRDFEKSMTQQFSGIGVEISNRTGVLTVSSLLPDTPAYRTGLDADDEILAVNGESTVEMTIYCAVSKITGPRGTKVTLTMRRPSTGQTWDVTIVRDRIVVQPLRGWRRTEPGHWDHLIDPVNGVGYIRLTAFTETSGPDLNKTLLELEKQGLNALILDLRFNSGGYLSSAAEVVDLFIREGVIVKSSPRHGLATYEIARRSGTHPNYPLVILINESSASASEIVAGALQDPQHERAVLVGERSYGKGSVQMVDPVIAGGGAQLKYTVAYYHLPSDQQVKNRYQMERLGRKDWGIAPDIDVTMYSNELRAMLDVQRDNDVLFRADHDQDGEKPIRHSLEMTLTSDPQLAVALMVAQAKLVAEGKRLTLTPLEELPAVSLQTD